MLQKGVCPGRTAQDGLFQLHHVQNELAVRRVCRDVSRRAPNKGLLEESDAVVRRMLLQKDETVQAQVNDGKYIYI
jgi:hypothetical protein